MKKTLKLAALAMAAAFALALLGCSNSAGGGGENGGGGGTGSGGGGNGGGGTPGATYTVTFNTVGGTDVQSQSVTSGATATRPSAPTKTDCAFVCWFKDGTYFDF
ncbi:MAG: InlB B-repeat-containing protein, partial [Treponema sp.]|nr:InlB B-repeat-containing protein [Treponema sp.]